jgi:hypothetical protein
MARKRCSANSLNERNAKTLVSHSQEKGGRRRLKLIEEQNTWEAVIPDTPTPEPKQCLTLLSQLYPMHASIENRQQASVYQQLEPSMHAFDLSSSKRVILGEVRD